jgi:DNA-binding CsgD family transcriptional regulator
MAIGSDADLLLSLYRDAMTLPAAAFQDSAIRRLRGALRFESAIWGQGYLAGPGDGKGRLVPVQVHTHEIDPAGFERWKAINRADKVIPIVLGAPGTTHVFHAPTMFSAKADAVMRDYARRFGRQSYLITAFGCHGSTLHEWCSFYRPDPDDHFTDGERERCQVLANHLTQAAEVNALVGSGGSGDGGGGSGGIGSPAAQPGDVHAAADCTALATRAGRLVSAQPAFLRLCAQQWREFDGRTVPRQALRPLQEGIRVVRLGKFTLSGRRIGDLWRLRLDSAPAAAALPPRRLDVAALFAQGHATKEIADLLGLAHSTVRNQLSAAYRALGVSDRSGLRARLAETAARRP